jgi:endonuclease/exonuclease/phosphatase family metal-dependent hydrolase
MTAVYVRIAYGLGILGIVLLVALALCVTWVAARNGRVGVPGEFADSPLLKNPPARLTVPVTLKVVTFNIQALWVVGKNRPARMRAIADYLGPLDPDMAGFQECFVSADRELLISELKKRTRLQYHQYYPSGTVGSGLLISSAFPIREAWFHRYQAIGAAWRFWEGDGLAGKGMGLARLELPDGAGFVDLFDTHAQAGYGKAEYKLVRGQEMAEAALFIRGARCGTAPAFVMGDLNSPPDAPAHKTLVEGANLERVMNIDSGIDHIYAARDTRYKFEVIETRQIPATIQKDGKPFALSDHNGYFTVVRITPAV